MPPRPALSLVLVLAALVAGCGADDQGTGTAGRPTYVESVRALLSPAGEMAQLVAGQVRTPPDPWPSPAGVDRLVDEARQGLEDLRGLRLDDAGLRTQRNRLADAFAVALGHMRAVARDLRRRDRVELRRDAPPFFAALRELPSRV
jgi:hypothetical protein